MAANQPRLILGVAITTARVIGWVLITIAILGSPQIRSLMGRLADSFGWLASIMLALAGVVWLIGVEAFIHFFDEYLSNN